MEKKKICSRNPPFRRRLFPGFEELLLINSLNPNQKRHGSRCCAFFIWGGSMYSNHFLWTWEFACQKVIWASYDHIQSNARAKPPNAPTWEDLWRPSDLGLLVSWINLSSALKNLLLGRCKCICMCSSAFNVCLLWGLLSTHSYLGTPVTIGFVW